MKAITFIIDTFLLHIISEVIPAVENKGQYLQVAEEMEDIRYGHNINLLHTNKCHCP